MPIGTPTPLGGNASNGTAKTTFVITTTAAVSAGERIFVDVAPTGTTAPSSVVDSAGNSYALDAVLVANGTSATILGYSAHAATALPSGGTITVTFGSTVNGVVAAEKRSGIAASSYLRASGTSSNTGSGTAVSSGATGSGPQVGDLHRVALGWSGGATTLTATAPYTDNGQQIASSPSPLRATMAIANLVTSAGAQTGAATFSGSRTYAASGATYIPAAAGDTTPPTLSSTSPATGATGVSTSLASISATFSEPVIASSGHMTVSGGVMGTLSGSGTSTLTLTITSGTLAYSTPYTVTLSSSITDAAGNAYAGGTFSFTTEAAPAGGTPLALPLIGQDDRLSVALWTAPGGQHLVEAVLPIADLQPSWNEHGPAACTFLLPRTVAEAAYLYDRAALPWVEVSDRGGRIWAGRLEDVSLVAGGVRCTALGPRRALDDLRYTAFWSSTQVSAWREVSDAELAGRTPKQYAIDTNNRLFIGLKKNATYTKDQIGELTFETPPGNSRTIVAFDFTYRQLLPNGTWRLLIFVEDRAFGSSFAAFTLAGTGAPQTGTQTLTFAANANARLSMLVQYNSATASPAITAEDGAFYAELTSIRVRSVTQSTVYASDIAAHLVGLINAVNPGQLQSTTALIQVPGLDLRDESPVDADMAEVLNRLVQLGDTQTPPRRWEWGVDLDRRLYLRPRGANARSWIINAAELPDVERSLDTLVTSLYTVYSTASNGRAVTTATQNTAAETRWGLRRERALSASTTSATQAGVHQAAALADAATATIRAQIPIPQLRDVAGAVHPGWYAQPGDTITIENLPSVLAPDVIDHIRTFTVSEVAWDAGQTLVTPELPLPTLDVLLARRDAGL